MAGRTAEIERLRAELERTKSELHRQRGDGLSVAEHIALVQRAQGIAETDHAELVQAQRELAEARAEIKRLHRQARPRAPAISGRRGLGRRRGTGRCGASRHPRSSTAHCSRYHRSMAQVPLIEPRPSSIAEAVEYVIAYLNIGDREAIAALDESRLWTLHHGFGTWIRNQLLRPDNAAAADLKAECGALLAAETAARVAADPLLARLAPKFEPLRPPPGADDFSAVIIQRVWERLRQPR